MIEYILLGLLFEKCLTGYEIKKDIEGRISNFYKVSYGSLYPCLNKLNNKKLVELFSQNEKGRQQKIYKITPEGKTEFLNWLKTPDLGSVTNDLVKVYFFDYLDEEIIKENLQQYELLLKNELNKLKQLELFYKNKEYDTKDKDYYKLATLYYGISIEEQILKWCKHIQEKKPLIELINGSDN